MDNERRPEPTVPDEQTPQTLPATVFYAALDAEPAAAPEVSSSEADAPEPQTLEPGTAAAHLPEDPAIIRLESESPAPDPEELAAQQAEAQETVPASPATSVESRLQEIYPSESASSAPAGSEVALPTVPESPAPAAQTSTSQSSAAQPSAAQPSGISNDLEEQIFAPSVPQQGPQAGEQFGDWQLQSDLGRGWFTALHSGQTEPQTVYVRPDPQWAGLLPHRLLPHTEARADVHVVAPVEGTPLAAPLPAAQAIAHLGELARLLFALDKQGYALTDFDPEHLVQTPDGLKLRLPPRVVKLGAADPGALRDGLTAPEVLAGEPATDKAGVYLLGAVLYRWLTGQTPPPGGPSLLELGSIPVPGVPQLLAGMLSEAQSRLNPAELMEALKRLSAPALPVYRVSARTTVGLNPDRPANEDSYGYTQFQIESDAQEELVLRACVSDGMGGMAAGEVASHAAVKAFLSSDKPDLPGMVWDANAAVLSAMNGRDGGCTISGVELRGTQLQLGHVGDTRAYLRASGEVRQLTQDHSFVAAMVASGQMTPEEAQVSPERNKVLRSLGSLRQPQPDYVQTLAEPLTLNVGDRVLLLSDGVWGEVAPATLTELLTQEPDPQALADRLVQLSVDAGAPDNATALVIERLA